MSFLFFFQSIKLANYSLKKMAKGFTKKEVVKHITFDLGKDYL